MIFFFHGHDTFRAKQKIDALKHKFMTTVDPAGHNVHAMQSDNWDWESLFQYLKGQGLLSQKKLIVLKDLWQVKDLKNHEATLLAWLDTVSDSQNENNIIFWSSEKIGKDKISKRLEKFKYVQEFADLTPLQAQQWAIELITQAGRSITAEAVQLLIASVGVDSWQLYHETQKLIHAGSYIIDATTVRSLVNARMQNTIFDLIDAVAGGNAARAQTIMSEALAEGMEPLYLTSMINRHMRLLVQASSISAATRNSYAIAEALGVHPYVGKKILSQINRWRPGRFHRLYQALLAADKRLKYSQSPAATLTIMIEQLQK